MSERPPAPPKHARDCTVYTDLLGCNCKPTAHPSPADAPTDRPSATWRPADRTVLAAMAPIVDGLCSGCGTKPTRETGSCRCLFRIDDVIRGKEPTDD
jgi:hypothetical protein